MRHEKVRHRLPYLHETIQICRPLYENHHAEFLNLHRRLRCPSENPRLSLAQLFERPPLPPRSSSSRASSNPTMKKRNHSRCLTSTSTRSDIGIRNMMPDKSFQVTSEINTTSVFCFNHSNHSTNRTLPIVTALKALRHIRIHPRYMASTCERRTTRRKPNKVQINCACVCFFVCREG